jgi:hypothetical protein
MMSSLREIGWVDFRQRSPNELVACAFDYWLLPRNLPMRQTKFPRDGIRDFEKQNHRSAVI